MLKEFGINCDWSTFAASHGKGAVDGVGGSVKVTVWRAIKSGKTTIQNPVDFYNYCNTK